MTSDQMKKLTALQRRRTLYEIVLEGPGGKYLLRYAPRSARMLIKQARHHGDSLLKLTGMDSLRWIDKNHASMGDWRISYSGRTEREAILTGELPYITIAILAQEITA